MLTLAALLAGLYAAYRWAPAAQEPVRFVEIEGAGERVSEAEIRAAVAPLVRTDFFRLDLHAIERAVRALPWVYRASVRRIWPDTVRVAIVEQRAVARWGEDALLNEWGEVFRPDPASFPPGLPRIDGSEARRPQLIRAWIGMNRAIVEATGRRLGLARLTEDRRGAWTLELSGRLRLALGRRDQRQRLRRVLAAWPRVIAGRERRVRYIDARYDNGMAVAWQETAAAMKHEKGEP